MASMTPRALRLLLSIAMLCTLSGCVTSKKYRMAKANTAPATTLDWKTSTSPVDLTLHTVIVYHGPGSWKREARWDEYVVQVVNSGDRPVTIHGASLDDFQGIPQLPGTDPWALEKLSYTNWDKYGKKGVHLVAGAGLVTVYAASVYAVGMSTLAGGAASAGAVAALDLIPIVAIVDIGVVAVMNHDNKTKVQQEFTRRRIALPHTLAPGEQISGSLFFPMTPGPQHLVLNAKAGDEPVKIVADLAPLASLHLKPKGT